MRFPETDLEWCESTVRVPSGEVHLRWKREGDTLTYRLDVLAGYAVEIENRSNRKLRALP